METLPTLGKQEYVLCFAEGWQKDEDPPQKKMNIIWKIPVFPWRISEKKTSPYQETNSRVCISLKDAKSWISYPNEETNCISGVSITPNHETKCRYSVLLEGARRMATFSTPGDESSSYVSLTDDRRVKTLPNQKIKINWRIQVFRWKMSENGDSSYQKTNCRFCISLKNAKRWRSSPIQEFKCRSGVSLMNDRRRETDSKPRNQVQTDSKWCIVEECQRNADIFPTSGDHVNAKCIAEEW